MAEPTIICPNCNTEIKLTESLAAPLIAESKRAFHEQLRAKETEISQREGLVAKQVQDLTREKDQFEAQLAQKVAEARQSIVIEEAAKAKAAAEQDVVKQKQALSSLQEQVRDKDNKLLEARRAQAEALRKARELEEKERELDITIEKRVKSELETARTKGKREAEEELTLKIKDKDQTITSMQRQIEDLKRRAEQGSQQHQGEVLELEIEGLLRSNFPLDSIDPVGKGEFGGDVLQRVMGAGGSEAGSILWETKRTRNWSDGWLLKLKADQRAAKADAAIIVSTALPQGIESFGLVDGVWVASTKCAIPVAVALRELLVSVSAARVAGEGQQTKMEMIYQYLTGPRFRHRVEAIVEQLGLMQADLDRERKAMQRLWAKREQQLRVMAGATAGMYGDLQGIAGHSIQEIDALDIELLAGPNEDSVEPDIMEGDG